MIDYDAMELAWQQHLAAQLPDVRTIEGAANLTAAFARSRSGTAIYTLQLGERSEGRVAVQNKAQLEDFEFSAVVVTDSLRPGEARQTNSQVCAQVKAATVAFKPPGAQRAFTFVKRRFFMQAGPRTAYEVTFRSSAYNTY